MNGLGLREQTEKDVAFTDAKRSEDKTPHNQIK